MSIEMKMPDLATTGSDVRIVRWLVEIGQPVKRGDLLVEVETDKAAVEVESIATGVLDRILVAAGDDVSAGQVIAVIENTGATVTTESAQPDATSSVVETTDSVSSVRASGEARSPSSDPGPPRKGMFARNREARSSDTPTAMPMSAAKRTVGRRMQESKQTVPHFYLEASFNAEPMVARRSTIDPKIAWDAFIVVAAGRALRNHREIACRLESDSLAIFSGTTIGVAVDVSGDLFVVPVDFDAAPDMVSAQLRGLVGRVRDGDAEARKLCPAALTVTNLGSSRVERFYAIVNPPEAAILAVGRIAQQPVVVDGVVIAQMRGHITLSVDHRVVNGKYAAQFLTAVVEELESL